MRKILMASAALFVVVGPAMATTSDTDSILVTTEVEEACLLDIASPGVALPAGGEASAATAFTYECNFGGEAVTADITYDSGFGGVSSDGGTTVHAYNIVPTIGAPGTSTTAFTNPSPLTAPNTTQNGSFTLDLVGIINVAGTYTDTLTVSIAP